MTFFGSSYHRAIVVTLVAIVWILVRIFSVDIRNAVIEVVFASVIVTATLATKGFLDCEKEKPQTTNEEISTTEIVETSTIEVENKDQIPVAQIVETDSIENEADSTDNDTASIAGSDPGKVSVRKKSKFHKFKRILRRKKKKEPQSERADTKYPSFTPAPTAQQAPEQEASMVVEKQDIPVLEINFYVKPEEYNVNMKQPQTSPGIEELKRRVADVANPVMVHKYGGEIRCYDRFLRARDGDLDKAEEMFRECVKFRQECGLDHNSDMFEQRIKAFDKFRSRWIGHYFKETTFDGSPIQLFQFGELQPKKLVKEGTDEDLRHLYLTWMEMALDIQCQSNSTEFQQRLGHEKDVEGDYQWKGMIEIYDLGGIGMHTLHIPGIMMLNRVLKIGQGTYPENLRACYFINVPWFFSSAWSVISTVLDAVTVDKITMSRSCPTEKLGVLIPESVIEQIRTRNIVKT